MLIYEVESNPCLFCMQSFLHAWPGKNKEILKHNEGTWTWIIYIKPLIYIHIHTQCNMIYFYKIRFVGWTRFKIILYLKLCFTHYIKIKTKKWLGFKILNCPNYQFILSKKLMNWLVRIIQYFHKVHQLLIDWSGTTLSFHISKP